MDPVDVPHAAEAIIPTLPADVPDWQTRKDEIHCPMCEYNLCGLTEPRCPECGYRFAWKDLLDAKARPHPYLFEHHPEANFKSFWKTAWGGLRPRKFWSELHAAQRSRSRRLLIYWILVCAMSFAPLFASVVPAAFALASQAREARESMRLMFGNGPQSIAVQNSQYPGPPEKEFFQWLWELRPDFAIMLVLIGAVLAWPWLTFVLLMIFRISMRRARVKSIHVLRATLYCFDVSLWFGLVLAVGLPGLTWLLGRPWVFAAANRSRRGLGTIPSFSGFPREFFGRSVDRDFMNIAHGIVGLALAISVYRLCVAYRRYLRFDWPVATVVATQLMLLLVLVIVALNWDSPLSSFWRHLMFSTPVYGNHWL